MDAVWILGHYRSGSSLLCDLLNNTGLFPYYNHSWHPMHFECETSFHEWLRLFGSKEDFEKCPPQTCKAIYEQYSVLFSDAGPEYIKTIFPDIKFLILHRNDVLAHAVSHYFTRITGKYHLFTQEEHDCYMSTSYDNNDETLLSCYADVKNWEGRWNKFTGFDIYYEEMKADPTTTLSNILKFLNIDTTTVEKSIAKTFGVGRRLFPMTHPNNNNILTRLKTLIGK